ncbi:MAG TPA: NYN domain-containing protein [Candidatus Limiplasma sp.]|nr:NYN domain-containing protein [Candidatus Limiplasma sp.]
MTRIAVFIDGSNFFYMQTKDLGMLMDPKKLLDYISQFGDITDAYYYTGEDDLHDAKQQGYLDALSHMGYSLVTKRIKTIFDPQTGSTKRKANLDIEIVLDMFNTIDNYDMAVLVSGDGDFERALQLLKSRGKQFKVLATDNFVASEIRRVAGMHYINLTDIADQLRKDQ